MYRRPPSLRKNRGSGDVCTQATKPTVYRNSANKIIATKNKVICFPNNRSFSLSRNKKINWKPSSGRSEVKCYKRLIYKQFVQVSGLCGDAILVHRFGVPFWCTNMAAGNQQKNLEFTFSIKALSFHSRTSIRAHEHIL